LADSDSHFYDRFIELHARKDGSGTRSFLVESADLENIQKQRVPDVCCGTGAVLLAFAERTPRGNFFGCDFSRGMLLAARQKESAGNVSLIQGNAARLPFADNCFHAVSCSHALYELKGEDRVKALYEMKRVVRTDGVVLIMEHEVPAQPLAGVMFRLGLPAMGSDDAREFVESSLKPFQKIFPMVILQRSPSGKSKLLCCHK